MRNVIHKMLGESDSYRNRLIVAKKVPKQQLRSTLTDLS